jgi:hypothetical protein
MPIPESDTAKRSIACPSPASDSTETSSRTSPSAVNLIALPIRLISTCRSRPESPRQLDGTPRGTTQSSSRPLSCARPANCPATTSSSSRRSKSCSLIASLPASIFEKSRMSLMIVSSASAESPMAMTQRR